MSGTSFDSQNSDGASARVALITGAAGGIGRVLCREFARAGYLVIEVDRVQPEDAPSGFVQFDLSRLGHSPEDAASFFEEVKTRSGGRLDVLVNNAAAQVVKPIEDVTPGDWAATLDTNLLAPFWLTQGLLPLLRAARGSVVNVSSIHSRLTKRGFSLYATSKGALDTMTRALALELAPAVRVNAIRPAATDTPMLREGFGGDIEKYNELSGYHPAARIAQPEEIARLALFLAGPDAGFITGACYDIDGGIGAKLHDPGD